MHLDNVLKFELNFGNFRLLQDKQLKPHQSRSSFAINTQYGKCSKILNRSCLLRQTGQAQIRQLLKKSLITVFPVCFYDKNFESCSPDNQHLLENRKRKVFVILDHPPYDLKKTSDVIKVNI